MKKYIILIIFALINLQNTPLFGAENPQKSRVLAQKNPHGFWVNAEDAALKEATKNKKLLFIDFYGIWCPPCNQLDELVFKTSDFKNAAKKFVLLKMDADQEPSWLLKSKYNIGGYPTLLIVKVEDNQASTEVDRIVGFFPKEVIIKKMQEALTSDGVSADTRVKDLLRKSIAAADENSDNESALKYINAGLALEPDNLEWKLNKLKIQSANNPKFLQSSEAKTILNNITQDRKKMSVTTLISQYDIQPTKEVLDELLFRVNPSTLYIDNESYNEADIYSLGIDLAEKQHNEQTKKLYTQMTVEAYEKLLKKYGNDSRALNLSYTYYLQKNGDYDKAQAVYDRMNKKYPNEFTFYYQAAQMELEQKNFTAAQANINKALEYAYGDNKIRSMDRLIKIYMAAVKGAASNNSKIVREELQTAIAKAEKFVKESKSSGDLKVRTDRYLNRLTDTVDEAKKLDN